MKLDAPIGLTLDFAMLTSIEVSAEVARAAVPESLDVLELRPSVALAALLVFQVAPGCPHPGFGTLPGYTELALAFQVAPALGRSIPRMAFYVASMTTSLAAADDFLRQAHWINAQGLAVSSEVSASRTSVSVADREGSILAMACEHPLPKFTYKQTLGQVFTQKEGKLAFYHELLVGNVHEHQSQHARVELYPHPFLAPLGKAGRTPRCYLQMLSEPGAEIRQFAEQASWF